MKKIVLIFLLIFSTGVVFGQRKNDKITYIKFDFWHSLRIPNHTVSIEIIKRQSEVVVKVKSTPRNDNIKWKYSKVDTSFYISKNKFIELSMKTSELNKINLNKALVSGKDGTECTIEFGNYGNTISYKFWTPDYNTEQRGLKYFLNLCETLIETGGLKINEIL